MHAGYSSEVDSLREKIRLNEREVGKLVNLLRLVQHTATCVHLYKIQLPT